MLDLRGGLAGWSISICSGLVAWFGLTSTLLERVSGHSVRRCMRQYFNSTCWRRQSIVFIGAGVWLFLQFTLLERVSGLETLPSAPFHPWFSGFTGFSGFLGSMLFFVLGFGIDRALCREVVFESRNAANPRYLEAS